MRSPCGLLALALLGALVGCRSGSRPQDFDPTRSRQEFVLLQGQDEGLLFNLPRDFNASIPEERLQKVFRKSYLPAGASGSSPQEGLDLTVASRAGRPPAMAAITPEQMVLAVAQGIRAQVCSSSFGASPLGPLEGPAPAGFAAVVACGRTPRGEAETTLIVALQGRNALFQLGWFERGAAQDRSPGVDLERWRQRLRGLGLRLCPAVAGGPDPSCLPGPERPRT